MIKALLYVFPVVFIINRVQAQVSYSVPLSVDQSGECGQVVAVNDRLELFAAYPNPATSSIQITSLEDGQLHIYNSSGLRVLSVSIPSGESAVDIRKFTAGLYILRLEAGNRHWQVRIVKE